MSILFRRFADPHGNFGPIVWRPRNARQKEIEIQVSLQSKSFALNATQLLSNAHPSKLKHADSQIQVSFEDLHLFTIEVEHDG